MAEQEKIRFLVVRFVGDENAAARAVTSAVMKTKNVRHVSTGATGRDPQPAIPEDTAGHVATLREAGHHEAATHLETVGAAAADHAREIHNVVRSIIDLMPPELQVGGRPPSEYLAWLLDEKRLRTEASAESTEARAALASIEQNILHRADEFTLDAVLETIKQARVKAAKRVARNESAAQRRAEHEALVAQASGKTP